MKVFNYKKGQIFTSANAIYYKHLGYLFILNGLIITTISKAIMIFAATFNEGPGHRAIMIGLSSTSVSDIFYGERIMIISWIMIEASKIHDEQKFII